MSSTKKFNSINILLLLGLFGIISVVSWLSLRGLSNHSVERCSEAESCWDATKKECVKGTCQCKEGWISDDENGCIDFNECKQTGDLYPCAHDYEGGYCVNHDPDDKMYECGCQKGYIGINNYGHGATKCISEEAIEIKETQTPTFTPTVTSSAVPSLYIPICPNSEIDFEVLSMNSVGSGLLDMGHTLKPTFEFELPRASQRLLISFDFIEIGMWDSVGIRGVQKNFVGVQLKSHTKEMVDINFGGFHYDLSETMRGGNEKGIHWSISSTESGLVNSEKDEQTHKVAIEIDSAKLSYESELLNLIINYSLEGGNDEYLSIKNLKIIACMDSAPSVAPSEFPTSIPSNILTIATQTPYYEPLKLYGTGLCESSKGSLQSWYFEALHVELAMDVCARYEICMGFDTDLTSVTRLYFRTAISNVPESGILSEIPESSRRGHTPYYVSDMVPYSTKIDKLNPDENCTCYRK